MAPTTANNDQIPKAKSELTYGSIASRPKEEGSELYGYALMVTGCFFYDIVSTIARACMVFHGLSAWNLIFLRGASHIVYCLIGIFLFFEPRKVFYVPKDMMFLLVLRAVLASIGVALVYKALSYVPMAIVVCVFFMGSFDAQFREIISLLT